MFLLPVGHEQDELRRWPWVSIGFVALCVVVLLGVLIGEERAERAALERARLVFEYAADKPYLTLDEDLLFGDTARLASETGYAPEWAPEVPRPDAAVRAEEQEQVDRLTRSWKEAMESVPLRALGLVPGRFQATDLITHFLTHAGWFHLLGNLFFFWLAGPPLEDVWGRWLYGGFLVAVGVGAGLLWMGRYPHSMEPVVGAGGAVAGLIGGFMVRFWRTRIQCFWVVWMTLKIYTGSFKAPAWLLVTLWLAYQVALATWFEPHTMPTGGVAIWANVFGLGTGVVLATVLRLARVEERWVEAGIVAATGEKRNPVIDEVHGLLEKGSRRRAWEVLEAEVSEHPENWDAVLEWWDLAGEVGRLEQVAPHLARVVRHELTSGQGEVARWHWEELRERAPRYDPPAELYLRLAEAVFEEGAGRQEIAALLAAARARLGSDPPIGPLVRLARVSVEARLPGAASLCERVAGDERVPRPVREEFRQHAATLDLR